MPRKISLVHSFLIAVRVGLESDRLDGPLVICELITLVFGKHVQFIVLGIPYNLMGFHHLRLAGLALWIPDLLQHIVLHGVIIQLGFPFAVQVESLDFTFYLSLVSMVPIILGTSGHKFHNGVITVHLIGEVCEEVSEDGVW